MSDNSFDNAQEQHNLFLALALLTQCHEHNYIR